MLSVVKRALFLLFIASTAYCATNQLYIYTILPQKNWALFTNDLQNEFQNVYGQLSIEVDLYSNQTIAGNKTLTGNTTINNLSCPNGISTNYTHWQIIFSTYIGTAVPSYTISGLNGNSDIMYKLDTCISGTTTGDDFGLRFNGDTEANYSINRLYSNGSTITPQQIASTTSIYWAYTNASDFMVEGTIYAVASQVPNHWRGVMWTGGSASLIYVSGTANWDNATDNITSITLFTFAGGTSKLQGYIALWALR